MSATYDLIQEARAAIDKKCPFSPDIGIILGTGLGKLADAIEKTAVIPYEEIPHFPLSTVEQHAGKLILGAFSGKKVVAMQGRFHFYEGYSLQQIVFPVQVMKCMKVKTLIVSNACGGLNPLWAPGTIMAITDHINLLPGNPLIGPNDHRIGRRFPDMSEPYSRKLLDLVAKVAVENRIRIERGVYAAMTGPSLETRAEYRMLRLIGADAVAGMEVLGLSVVTDACLPDALEPADIRKIIETANKAELPLITLIQKTIALL
jgi:purine-nucleoside phosphorylase